VAIDRVALLRNAEKLLRQGKLDQAIVEYRRVVDDQPRDWNTANALGDLYFRAGQIDKAVGEYLRVANSLGQDGFFSKAGALYKKILKIRPHDEDVLLQAAEMSAQQELFVDARTYLNAVCEQRRSRFDTAGIAAITIRLAALDPSDYDARLAGARAQVEIGNRPAAVSELKLLAGELTEQGLLEQAMVALREAAHVAPADVEVKSSLARILAELEDQESEDEATALAFEISEAAVARGDWQEAVAALQRSLKRSPADVPVLLRLVEVSVDGGLNDIATLAQIQLADVFLTAGSANEARFIAEDLVARHPEDAANIERLRRALVMLGEPDPEALIAARLSELEPLGSDSLEAPPIAGSDPVAAGQLSELISPRPSVPTSEADLSVAIEGLKPAPMTLTPVPPPASPSTSPRNLDDVFADMREEATRSFATNNPDQELATGLAFYRAGQLDLAVPRLEAAARAAENRFAAAATLGRVFLERGEAWHAIEWFERAAEAAAPTPADGHRLLYELADALEGAGEVARALAICLELRADAGEYQDVSIRVDRLVQVQARG
jgi:tetratricopeptide (TPR) repeat protein